MSSASGNFEIVVFGAAGRMGQAVLNACKGAKNPSLQVVAALEREGSPELGKPALPGIWDIPITSDRDVAMKKSVIGIDFTSPESSLQAVAAAQKNGSKMVIGTTGFSDEQKDRIHQAAKDIPIVMAPNMSIGVNVLFRITEMVAKTLGNPFNIEITEIHHNQKKDAPSGTAWGLAESAARGRDLDLKKSAKHGREGMIGARGRDEIGIHALRGGDVVGDHSVLFAGPSERVELKHVAHGREAFANGAVRAAEFLLDKSSGFFTMTDVLGL